MEILGCIKRSGCCCSCGGADDVGHLHGASSEAVLQCILGRAPTLYPLVCILCVACGEEPCGQGYGWNLPLLRRPVFEAGAISKAVD